MKILFVLGLNNPFLLKKNRFLVIYLDKTADFNLNCVIFSQNAANTLTFLTQKLV